MIFSFIRNKLKLNNKKPMLRHGVLLITTVMLFCVAVWAWFGNNNTSEASGINMTMNTSNNLLISLDYGANYLYGIDMLDSESQQYIGEKNKIKDVLFMQDITSDGFSFLMPEFSTFETERIPDTSKNWSIANPNRAYISQTIYFKTTYPAEIYMGKDTKIITRSEAEEKPIVSTKADGSDLVNKSSGGNYSADGIVGALRISAVNSDNEKCFVMIPRPDVELIKSENGTGFNLLTGTSVSSNTKIHQYYNTEKQYKTTGDILTEFTAVEGTKPQSDKTLIATTVKNEDGDYIGVATVNIWLEGCDAETRRVLSGGEYSINLNFVSYEVQ